MTVCIFSVPHVCAAEKYNQANKARKVKTPSRGILHSCIPHMIGVLSSVTTVPPYLSVLYLRFTSREINQG